MRILPRMSFTLVEMIVAMGVLSILTVLLFTVLSETSKAITLSSGRSKIYTDLRVVVDQMARDFQQSVDDDRYNCFHGYSNRVHFVATIDNNTGNEEAEVGYYYYIGSNMLLKSVQFSKKGYPSTANSDWQIGTAQTNAATTWETSPATNNFAEYVTVLENVKHVEFQYRDTNFTLVAPPWLFTSRSSNLPAYVRIIIAVADPNDVIRYRGMNNVSWTLVRWFTNEVYLPRRQ